MGRRREKEKEYAYSSSSSDEYSSDSDSAERRRGRNRDRSARRKDKSRREKRDRNRFKSKSRESILPRRFHYDAMPAVSAPKIAMILLLGPEEIEFRLTEGQILYDSPNDLTSTYYADNDGEVKQYRMPDRDAAIFSIIYRYMNKETVVPLKKSMIPKYLSYQQTELKLAEEAKFYRLNRLMRLLPPLPATSQSLTGPSSQSGYNGGEVSERPVMSTIQRRPRALQDSCSDQLIFRQESDSSGPSDTLPVPTSSSSHLPTSYAPAKFPSSTASTDREIMPSRTAAPSSRSSTSYSGRTLTHTRPQAQRNRSSSLTTQDSHPQRHLKHSERSAVPKPKTTKQIASTLSAYIYKPGCTFDRLVKTEKEFPLINYPSEAPLPHLMIKATAAEIKFSAFINSEDATQFELRYSLRIFDEPATRPLASRIDDSTIKAVDSHLRLNGVLSDIECRDIPIRIRHAPSSKANNGTTGRRAGDVTENGTMVADDDGCFTSGLDEILELMTTKGYVKWPRIWQDTFTNLTSPDSLHQRISLPVSEVLFEVEFPKDTALLSETVGGRGFVLDSEDEQEMLVRNYVVTLYGIKVDTRKMRRLKELNHDAEPVEETRRSRSQPPPTTDTPGASDRHYRAGSNEVIPSYLRSPAMSTHSTRSYGTSLQVPLSRAHMDRNYRQKDESSDGPRTPRRSNTDITIDNLSLYDPSFLAPFTNSMSHYGRHITEPHAYRHVATEARMKLASRDRMARSYNSFESSDEQDREYVFSRGTLPESSASSCRPQYRSAVSLPTPTASIRGHQSTHNGFDDCATSGRPTSTASEEVKRRAMANW